MFSHLLPFTVFFYFLLAILLYYSLKTEGFAKYDSQFDFKYKYIPKFESNAKLT